MLSDLVPLLLVDSDLRRCALLEKHLGSQGFNVVTVHDLAHVRLPGDIGRYQAFIVAMRLAGASGLDLCHSVRSVNPYFPIFMIEGGGDVRARIAALGAGADDVQSFPFSLDEFTARLRALLRRSSGVDSLPQAEILTYRDLSVNVRQRSVCRGGEAIRLTVKEYDLLSYFLRNKEQVLPRQQILHAVWGDTWVGDDNLLDVYIRYLRKKIERPDLEPLIHTIRGVGFMLK